MHWYVSRNGRVRGPFTELQMLDLIGRGEVARGDLVDADQAGKWWPIEQVPTFAASLPVPLQQMLAPLPVPAATSANRRLLNGCLIGFGVLVAGVVAMKILFAVAFGSATSTTIDPPRRLGRNGAPAAPADQVQDGASERCRITSHDSNIVPVFPTSAGLDEFIDGAAKRLSASDLDVIAAANGGFGVQSGTRCQMLDFGFTQSRVRILEGEHAGSSGWVPTEFSHP